MTDATTPRSTDKPGFSSRWMLPGRAPTSGTIPGDAQAAARHIDTDGDGIADTLSVRVDAAPRSFMSRVRMWVARSIVSIVLVAALVAAAAAIANLYQVRAELDRTTTMLEQDRAALNDARADADRADARVATLERDAGDAIASTKRLEAERDELELEVRVLRGMLLDQERRATPAR